MQLLHHLYRSPKANYSRTHRRPFILTVFITPSLPQGFNPQPCFSAKGLRLRDAPGLGASRLPSAPAVLLGRC